MLQRSKPRHAKRKPLRVGPVFAFDAIMLMLASKRELEAATAAQLAQYAQDGAR